MTTIITALAHFPLINLVVRDAWFRPHNCRGSALNRCPLYQQLQHIVINVLYLKAHVWFSSSYRIGRESLPPLSLLSFLSITFFDGSTVTLKLRKKNWNTLFSKSNGNEAKSCRASAVKPCHHHHWPLCANDTTLACKGHGQAAIKPQWYTTTRCTTVTLPCKYRK